jgi:peptidoglycan/xylan/chitin deacetylase (PgdA/CDA1 family)
MKIAARRVLTHPALIRAAFSLSGRSAPIFMCHRFRDVGLGTAGHDPQTLRANLAWLRANRCSLLSLSELFDRLAEGAPLDRAVAFTVDDGYTDFARVAAPVFAEFDCPVTVFLTTGFLDSRRWMWWDQVRLALKSLRRDEERRPLIAALNRMPELQKLQRVGALVQESGLELPATAPPEFAPVTWDDVRRLARSGVTFGPHSVTHPVLSQTGPEQSRHEIAESWRRVRDEVGDGAVPIFCYPNGGQADFGMREEEAVASSGMRAAVAARPGYAARRDLSGDRPSARFRLPRFSYPDAHSSFIQVAGRIERFKLAVRAAIGVGST